MLGGYPEEANFFLQPDNTCSQFVKIACGVVSAEPTVAQLYVFVGYLSMSKHNHLIAPASMFFGLTNVDPGREAADALKSGLITAYEQSIEDGVTPTSALAIVLGWVAEEFERIGAETAPQLSSNRLPEPTGSKALALVSDN